MKNENLLVDLVAQRPVGESRIGRSSSSFAPTLEAAAAEATQGDAAADAEDDEESGERRQTDDDDQERHHCNKLHGERSKCQLSQKQEYCILISFSKQV